MACDGHNCYFSFWAISCSFTDQKKMTQSNRPKNQFFEKKKKKQLEKSFYACAPKIMICSSIVPEIWCMTDGWMDRLTNGQTEKVTYRGGCPT